MQTSATDEKRIFIDHYAVLGLAYTATGDEVKRRFRKLAKVHHPDVTGGDGLDFLEVLNAYRILSENDSRNRYNVQYIRNIQLSRSREVQPANDCLVVPESRFRFPGNVVTLARRGLLRKNFRKRDRRLVLKIDYDMELPLTANELNQPILIRIPVIARIICPDCLGSDPHCYACDGRGSYKNTRMVKLRMQGGLLAGQILELNLTGLRPEPLCYFKKSKLRIKITDKY